MNFKSICLGAAISVGMSFPCWAGDYTLSTYIVPKATYNLSEMYDALFAKNATGIGHLGSFTIVNNSPEDGNFILRIRVFSQLLGTTNPIIDVTTSPTTFPISAQKNGGSVSKQNPGLINSSLFSEIRTGVSEMKSRINKSAYSQNEVLKRGGLAPSDTLTYELYLFKAGDSTDNLNLALASFTESIDQPYEPGEISLIYPPDGFILNDNTINFQWSSLKVRKNVVVNYTFKLWDKKPNSIQDTPYYSKNIPSVTSLSLNSNALGLKSGSPYYWAVSATDELGGLIGNVSKSNVQSFEWKADQASNAKLAVTPENFRITTPSVNNTVEKKSSEIIIDQTIRQYITALAASNPALMSLASKTYSVDLEGKSGDYVNKLLNSLISGNTKIDRVEIINAQ